MMRIRGVFLLSIVLGSAVGMVAALLFAAQQWSALQATQAARHDTLLLVSALRLPETMNMERAFINARMVEPGIASSKQFVPVMRQTRLVDATFLDTLRLTASAADSAALQAIQGRLWNIRQDALAALGQPQARQAVHQVDGYLQAMFAVQEAAYGFATAVHERINASNPYAGRATRLALLAWDLRDWSGRQTTMLISYIGRRLPMAGEQAETLAIHRGRIEQKWLAARSFAASLDNPDVTAALAAVEQGFWAEGGEAYAAQVVPNRGQILDLDVDAFRTSIRPILDTILSLRDSALTEALRLCDADILASRDRFRFTLSLLLLTACGVAAATYWFDRRVVGPIEQTTRIILALAGGTRDIEVPLRQRNDELGQMAKAIETLRRNAMRAEASGREMLACQQAQTEEKSRLLAELSQTNEDLAAVNSELEALAATDALTGIPNRRSFDLFLNREWRRAQREDMSLGLLLLDIDHFKSFNDHHGHPAGDTCLARVAAAIVAATGRPGDLVARYGGEEFAAILPATQLEGAAHMAEQIRLAVAALDIRHPVSPYGVVTISIGAAVVIPRASMASGALVSNADNALYAAKRGGRNQVATLAVADAVPA